MINKILIKVKSINLIGLLKNFVKRLILNGIKMAVAYQITILLLGYTLFTPILIRLFNITPKNNVAECWSLFELPSQQPTFSGLTWDQVVIGGIVFGTVFFTLNFAQNYFTESIYPPLMRSMGYDYYSLKEKNAMLLDKANIILEQNQIAARVIDQQSRAIKVLSEKISIIDNNLLSVHGYLTDTTEGSLLHKIRFDFDIVHASINETRNTIIEMQRGQLRLIQEKLMLLERSLSSVSSMTADLTNRPIPNFREDLAEITSMFRDFQTNVLNTLSEPISTLRAQVLALETFEPNELHTVTERLRQTLGAFEHLAGQVQVAGANIEAAMQTSADRITEYENQVSLPETSTVVAGSNGGTPNSIPTETYVGGVAAARARLNNESNEYSADSSGGIASTTRSRASSVSENSHELSQYINRPASGGYSIEQQGDELLIRLSLKGVNIPIQEMVSNNATNQVVKYGANYLKNTITEMAVGGLVTGAATLARGALVGGLNGMLSTAGITPIMRLTASPSTFLTPNQLEAAAKAGAAGDKLGTVITVLKEFGSSAWKYF